MNECETDEFVIRSKGKNKRKRISFFFYDFVKITGFLPAFIFIRYKKLFVSKEAEAHHRGPLLVISNHSTYIDPVIIMKALFYRRVIFMATKDLFRTKLSAWFFRHVHCIEVDKGNVGVGTVKDVLEHLKEGRAVMIFPEGGVNESSDDSNLQAFKDGASLMALKSGASVLPVYINKGKKVIVIGEKIDVTSFLSDGKKSGLRAIRDFSELLYAKESELKSYSENY